MPAGTNPTWIVMICLGPFAGAAARAAPPERPVPEPAGPVGSGQDGAPADEGTIGTSSDEAGPDRVPGAPPSDGEGTPETGGEDARAVRPEPPPEEAPSPPPRRVALPPLGEDGRMFEPPAATPDERMDWDLPVTCLHDESGEVFLRYQCRPPRGRETEWLCLYSPGRETHEDEGKGPELERVQWCSASFWIRPDELVEFLRSQLPDGSRLVAGIAEAPPGWRRDERGRVFQVNFDLYRRVYLGTRWYPAVLSPAGTELGRVGLEFGSRIETLSDDLRSRYRIQVLPGEVLLNPLGVSGMLLRFDSSRDADDPFLRFTTFWGTPARHDLYADVGGWFDALGVEYRPRNSDDEIQLRFLAGGLTWDLWHSPDMYSYVRLRLGAAFDDLYLDRDGVDNRLALGPLAAVEGDFTFDADGFHHLTFGSSYEAPFVWREDGAAAATFTQRFANELAYEVIFLAINDQPLTFRASVGGGYRSDVAEGAAGWELTAGAGLRFSFWVPARDLEALREIRARGRD